MAERKFRNLNWSLPEGAEGRIQSWEAVKLAVLMDIRDELQKLNGVLACPNFTAIPHTLTKILRNVPTHKKRKSRSINV